MQEYDRLGVYLQSSLTSALNRVNAKHHAPASLRPGTDSRSSMNGRLGRYDILAGNFRYQINLKQVQGMNQGFLVVPPVSSFLHGLR
jgi:hypothetical protein